MGKEIFPEMRINLDHRTKSDNVQVYQKDLKITF